MIRTLSRFFLQFSIIILWRFFSYEAQYLSVLQERSRNSIFRVKIKPTTTLLPPLAPEETIKVKRVLDKKRIFGGFINATLPFLIFLSLPFLWVSLSYKLQDFLNSWLPNGLSETCHYVLPMLLAMGLYTLLLYSAVYYSKSIPFMLSMRYSVLFTCWYALYHFLPDYHQGAPKVTWAVYTSSSYRTEIMIKLWNYTQSYKHLNILIIAFVGLLLLRLSSFLYQKGIELIIEKPVLK